MSVPGFGDSVRALEVIKWIYDNYFDKDGTSDVKYQKLKNDIHGIYETLTQLRTRSATSPLLTTGLYITTSSGAVQPGSEISAALDELNEPLQALRAILVDKVACEKDGRGFIKSIQWALTTENDINDLLRRVQFNMQKILLVTEPEKLDIMHNMEHRIEEILNYVRPQPDIVLEPIPAWMDRKFVEALSANPPESYNEIGRIPLLEGLDACIRHYKQSTVMYVDGEDTPPTIQQYINLRKAHYLILKLEESSEYRATPPGSINRRAVRQLEVLLHAQYQRKIKFADEDLRARHASSFALWPAPEVDRPHISLEADIQEDKVLDLSLPTQYPVQAHNLVVLRTDNTRYRIVERTLREDSIGALPTTKEIHLHHDRLIPWYANQSQTACGIGFYNELHETNKEYKLKNEQDVLDFQRIFTGYRVLDNHVGVGWVLNEQKRMAKVSVWSKSIRGVGRVQIWAWDSPLQSRSDAPRSSLTRRENQATGGHSHSSSVRTPAVATLLQGQDMNRVSTIDHGSRRIVVAVRKRIPPVLLIYTRTGSTEDCTFLHLELVAGLRIIPNACDCAQGPGSCTRTVIQNRQGNSVAAFIIKKFAVKQNQVTAWNLAVFSGHQPRHPQYLKEKGIERISTTFLILDFSSAGKRQNFNDKLTKEIDQRDTAADIDSRAVRRANTYSQNPSSLRAAPNYPPPEGHRSFSSDETAGSPDAGSTSSAPEIDAMSFSPGFTPSIVFDYRGA